MSPRPAGAQRRNTPVLFVTTEIPPDRVGAFRALAARVPVEFALFGGGLHATSGVDDHGLHVHHVSQREVYGLAASRRYGAVVAGTVGRTALPAAWLGAERARVPFVLWTALWAHPRSLAHLPGSLLLRVLYRRSDAVVTYGPHVSALASRLGARHPVVAPQAVDVDFWTAHQDLGTRASSTPPTLLYVGRDDPGKGVDWLLRSWQASGLGERGEAELRLVGPEPPRASGVAGVVATGPLAPVDVRAEMGKACAVVVPSEQTGTFREPWGLVVNEAMHTGTLVIASTQVGAVAGGLAVPGRTALVTPAGDVNGLSTALLTAAAPQTPELLAIRRNAAQESAAYTHDAWAATFASALEGSLA
ncbi:MAG: glycosyltransferase family 4 protein [Solirubrobacteraceae bacterium]|nr:glycosyltransferase family 4 protein [Solirubrobacteraceae bacterium]